MTIDVGKHAIGNPFEPPDHTVQPEPPRDQVSVESAQATIDYLASRIVEAEKKLAYKVDGDQVLAAIWLTEEDVLIKGDKVSLIGEVTFLDWIRDVNGNPTATIDPAITTIIGDKIRTGVIESNNWAAAAGSRIDLDNGTIVLGGSGTPKFSVDTSGVITCTDAIIGGTSVIGAGGTSLSTVETNAASGAAKPTTFVQAAVPTSLQIGDRWIDSDDSNKEYVAESVGADQITAGEWVASPVGTGDVTADILNSDTALILKGQLDVQNTGGVSAGSLVWDDVTGALISGSGVALTEAGIIGATGGTPTFTITTAGAATFAGTLSAPVGTLGAITGGTINTSGWIKCAGATAAPDNASIYGTTSAGSSYFAIGGEVTNSATGVTGQCTGTGTGIGVFAASVATGTALSVSGTMSMTNSTVVTNLNADLLDGNHSTAFLGASATAANSTQLGGYASSVYMRVSATAQTGSTTTTFTSTPQTVGTNASWAQVVVSGITVYVPYVY